MLKGQTMIKYINIIVIILITLNNVFYATELTKILKKKNEIKLQQINNNYIGSVKDCFVDKNLIYIVDSKLSNVKVFNKKGQLVKVVGKKGRGPGEFQIPIAIDVDQDHLYVSDIGNGQLNIFNKESGDFVRAFRILDGRTIKVLPSKILISYLDGSNNKSLHYYDYKGNIIESYINIPQITLDNQMVSDFTTFDLDSKNNIYFVHEMQYNVLKGKKKFESFIVNNGDKKYNPPPKKSFQEFYSRKKLTDWINSWSHILKLIVNSTKDKLMLFIVGPGSSGKWLDIYNLKGDVLFKNVQTENRLLCSDDKGNIYFLKEKFDGTNIDFYLQQFEFIK